jgi:hypothetical protein
LLFGFIYYYLRSQKQREKLKPPTIQSANSKKLHDELANDVYQTMAFGNAGLIILITKKHYSTTDTIYSQTRNISKENSTIAMGPDYIPNLKEMIWFQ